jgi:hypothetical protein
MAEERFASSANALRLRSDEASASKQSSISCLMRALRLE